MKYAVDVANYIEHYRPDPARITWRQAQFHEAVLIARSEELTPKKGKKQHG